MKKIIFIFCLFLCAVSARAQFEFGNNIYIKSAKPIDARTAQANGQFFTSQSQANNAANNPLAYRYVNMEIPIDSGGVVRIYAYKGGTANSNLTFQRIATGGVGNSIVVGNGIGKATGVGGTDSLYNNWNAEFDPSDTGSLSNAGNAVVIMGRMIRYVTDYVAAHGGGSGGIDSVYQFPSHDSALSVLGAGKLFTIDTSKVVMVTRAAPPIPIAPDTGQQLNFTGSTGLVNTASHQWSSAGVTGVYENLGKATKKLAAGQAGGVYVKVDNISMFTGFMLSLDAGNTEEPWNTLSTGFAALPPNDWFRYTSGTGTAMGTFTIGHYLALYRRASGEVVILHGPTYDPDSMTQAYSYGTITGDLYIKAAAMSDGNLLNGMGDNLN